MAAPEFSGLVTLACHDLRTPLATVNGFAKTLQRSGQLDERDARYAGMIEVAAEELSDLVDLLVLAARIESGRYDPALADADTLELARSDDERIGAEGSGETVKTDEPVVRRSLRALAGAALRHGDIERIMWTVNGLELELAPVLPAAMPVVTGEEPNDLGALVARIAIERLGGSLEPEGETLRVRL